MAIKHLYITEFGSGLPLIHWAMQDPSKFAIHTRNSAVMKYLLSNKLKFNDDWNIDQNAESVFIGTCSVPEAYDEIILRAKELGIKSHAYIDSWVNYSIRLNVEPVEILVSDPWAIQLAKKTYQHLTIVHFEDYHLQFLTNKYSPSVKNSVLYIDSPTNAYNNMPNQLHNVNCICQQLPKISKCFPNQIIFRKHPGYKANECVDFLIDSQIAKISDNPESLLSDLELAGCVVGPVSYVHYLAENLGIPAFTTRTPNSNWHGPKFRSLNL